MTLDTASRCRWGWSAYPARLGRGRDHDAFVSTQALPLEKGGLDYVAVELDMVPVRRQVAIARIWEAIDEHGDLRPPGPLEQAQRLLDDIGTWATALRAGRAAVAASAAT